MCAYDDHYTLRVRGGMDGYVYCFSRFSCFWVDFRVDYGGVLSTVNVSGVWLVLPTMSRAMSRMDLGFLVVR
ncbi:hypothetical protein [Methanobacterium petrolearium]|uniref:hypothetical protein n=1 Tax=Methanobacterium petrolearium TaxID=710190 RepID=UPI0030821E75